MHPNLSNIVRTWVAFTIVTGTFQLGALRPLLRERYFFDIDADTSAARAVNTPIIKLPTSHSFVQIKGSDAAGSQQHRHNASKQSVMPKEEIIIVSSQQPSSATVTKDETLSMPIHTSTTDDRKPLSDITNSSNKRSKTFNARRKAIVKDRVMQHKQAKKAKLNES
jgi:hypothetical protein